MEGTFLNGQADGMMLVTYPDFSSRKELWKNGKLLATGEKVPRGVVPKDPDYKSPEQIAAEKAAEADAKFAAQIEREKNPGALYALGDEWAEKGDMAKAKSAWRELIKRFPDSPLATQAAGRLSGASSGAAGTTQVKASPSTDSLTGEWRGENSGNVVYIVQEANALVVSAVSLNPGQDPNAMRFAAAGPGTYIHTWPDGQRATVTVTSMNRMEVLQPTWSEVFVR
jgi:outer membrane protein assembly factor BamD (BamD/ComL family)